jgi:predicted esterase
VSAFGPHAGQPAAVGGVPVEQATAALILVHGRGGSAEDILGLGEALGRPDVTLIAPRAAGYTWYPQSFLAPVEANEPGRSSGLSVIESIIADLADAGIPSERIVLTGFSQGACLTLEFIARHPRRYAAVAGLTGGLIGPAGSLGGYEGSLAGTPVFLGSGDPDPHVPWARVEETAEILRGLEAEVETQRYPGRAHTVSQDELQRLRRLVDRVLS